MKYDCIAHFLLIRSFSDIHKPAAYSRAGYYHCFSAIRIRKNATQLW